MHTKAFNILFLFLFLAGSCSAPSFLEQGRVELKEFYTKVDFLTVKSLVIVPCEIGDSTKNFLFDTGATVTAVHRDSIFGEIIEVSGASNRKIQNGSETIKSLKIGEVNFMNTFATNQNFGVLRDSIPNFGGILGRTVMDKGNWLIDYPAKTLEISNRDLSDDSFTDIKLEKSSGAPYTLVEVDGLKYRAIIDLGSTSYVNVPEGTKLADHLLETYPFETNERRRYTVGGLQNITEKIGVIPVLNLGASVFTNVKVNINESSQMRIGMRLFENALIYIDNTNGRYRIKLGED
jgi:hypothetical protein